MVLNQAANCLARFSRKDMKELPLNETLPPIPLVHQTITNPICDNVATG